MITVLKAVPFKDRKPIKGGRYPIQYYGGTLQSKRWIPDKQIFGRLTNQSAIDLWYEPISLPSPDDMQFIVQDRLPQTLAPEQKSLILQGAKLAMIELERILKK